jgi:hypothetical protein
MNSKLEITATAEDLKPYDLGQQYQTAGNGNIIKSRFVSHDNPPKPQKIEVSGSAQHHSAVVVQRNGEIVEYVHVTCQCGVKTAIKLEYDGE